MSDNPVEKMQDLINLPASFAKEGSQFLNRCAKPTGKEFSEICRAVALGFFMMGFLGYFVKLIHIPINNILVGGA